MIVEILDATRGELIARRFDSKAHIIVLQMTKKDLETITKQDSGKTGIVIFLPERETHEQAVFAAIRTIYKGYGPQRED